MIKQMNLNWEEVMAIGDGVNDYGMFEMAGMALGVKVKEPERVDRNFETTKDMLLYIIKFLEIPYPL